jgi:iron complex transport system ATP-binding protein
VIASIAAGSDSVWSLRDVRFQHQGAMRATIDDVTVDIARGQMTALLGPNGAGKSTLLQLLLGILSPASGTVLLDGRPLAEWTRRDIARRVGVVPQGETEPLFSVREIVAMGRYPHLGPWQRERPEDIAAMYQCLLIAGSPPFRAAKGSVCAWLARSRRNRACSCWTNRRRSSTSGTR